MEFCSRMKKLIFILLIVILSFQIVYAGQNYDGMQFSEDENGLQSYISNSESGKVSLSLDDGTRHYWNLANNSFIKVANGSVSEADLTATKETSWTFGNQTLKVQEGTRVVFKDGKLEVFGKEGDSFEFEDKISETTSQISLGKDAELFLERNVLKGKNFNVGDVQVKEGSLSASKGGYVLEKNSLAEWKGLTIGNKEDLFLATSFDETQNHDNWLFPEEHRLRGKGEGFELRLNPENRYIEGDDNPYAVVESWDNFEIKAIKDFKFDLINRDPKRTSEGKIPLMNVEGEFMMNQDSKTIYTQEGDILIKKDGVLFGEASSISETSPVELIVAGQEKKYIVSNFKGIATVNRDELIGLSDERYSDSIHFQRASVENRYNYPTKKDFEDITKKNFLYDVGTGRFTQDNPTPQQLSQLIDFYETLPDKDKKALQSVHLYYAYRSERNEEFDEICDTGTGSACYNHLDGSIHILSRELDIETFRHETAHLHHDTMYALENYQGFFEDRLPLVREFNGLRNELKKSLNVQDTGTFTVSRSTLSENQIKVLERIEEIQKEFPLINENLGAFNQQWLEVAGGSTAYGETYLIQEGDKIKLEWKERSMTDSRLGFIRPYGATELSEDVATFVEKIIQEPEYFKEKGLIIKDDYFYNPIYAKKIELLHDSGFISDQEYLFVCLAEGINICK